MSTRVGWGARPAAPLPADAERTEDAGAAGMVHAKAVKSAGTASDGGGCGCLQVAFSPALRRACEEGVRPEARGRLRSVEFLLCS